jgi:hypothetical protein
MPLLQSLAPQIRIDVFTYINAISSAISKVKEKVPDREEYGC